MTSADDIIEGSYRVIATRPFRSSPKRQRAVARIVFWNLVLVVAVVWVPYVLA